jgi:serine palmitoyltransferase
VTGKSRYNIYDKEGYSSLFKNWESFFTRRLFNRIQDCWNRPLSSGPGVYIDVMERISNDDFKSLVTSGTSTRCLNLGSYNYLGFADDWKETCRDDVTKSVDEWPISMTSSRQSFGTTRVHIELEELVARFVGKEAAAIFPMGYGTNSTVIPILMGAGSLIISDSLNHTSIVNGSRSSEAQIRVFKHNNTKHLEEVLREGNDFAVLLP